MTLIQMLMRLGYEYLPRNEVERARKASTGGCILEDILFSQLSAMNGFEAGGKLHNFSDDSIRRAIAVLHHCCEQDPQEVQERVSELLRLGCTVPVYADDTLNSHRITYINWDDWKSNRFSLATRQKPSNSNIADENPIDIDIYVNGIPFAVVLYDDMEKKHAVQAGEAALDLVEQCHFIQLIIDSSNNSTRLTTGLLSSPWVKWGTNTGEIESPGTGLEAPAVNDPSYILTATTWKEKHRLQSTLTRLIEPDRLLELVEVYRFMCSGITQFVRYQEYLYIDRISKWLTGRRSVTNETGIALHANESGKLKSMLLLASAIRRSDLNKMLVIILVTNRLSSSMPLQGMHGLWGMELLHSSTGRDLRRKISNSTNAVIVTSSAKMAFAVRNIQLSGGSDHIYMLVDVPADQKSCDFVFFNKVKQVMPDARCVKFAGLAGNNVDTCSSYDAHKSIVIARYTYDQAIMDEAVVPLLYEHRNLCKVNRNTGFKSKAHQIREKDISSELFVKSELHLHTSTVCGNDKLIYQVANDIADDYCINWKKSGYKALLVAQDAIEAEKYCEYLKRRGLITVENIASMVDAPTLVAVSNTLCDYAGFGNKLLINRDNESASNYESEALIHYIHAEEPELLICNVNQLRLLEISRIIVIYLACELKQHTLWGALRAVNLSHYTGMYNHKTHGAIVDYTVDGIINAQSEAGFDAFDNTEDDGSIRILERFENILDGLAKLLSNIQDILGLETGSCKSLDEMPTLADKITRNECDRLISKYADLLNLALSTRFFVMDASPDEVKQYLDKVLWLYKLQKTLNTIDHGYLHEHENYQRLGRCLDILKNIATTTGCEDRNNSWYKSNIRLTNNQGEKLYSTGNNYSPNLKKSNMYVHEDRLSYGRSSSKKPGADTIVGGDNNIDHTGVLPSLYHEIFKTQFASLSLNETIAENVATKAFIAISGIIHTHWKVDFWLDTDAQKRVADEIDDYLFDEIRIRKGIPLGTRQLDNIIDEVMKLHQDHQHIV